MAVTSHRRGTAWPMPAPGGTANYLKAYVGASGAFTCDCIAAINQKDSGGANSHGEIGKKENLDCGSAAHWEEFTFADEVLTQGVNYILNIIGDKDAPGPSHFYYVYGDEDGGVASYHEDVGSYTVADPWDIAPEGTMINYSIYVNYEEAAVGLENKSANMGSKMVAAGLI